MVLITICNINLKWFVLTAYEVGLKSFALNIYESLFRKWLRFEEQSNFAHQQKVQRYEKGRVELYSKLFCKAFV